MVVLQRNSTCKNLSDVCLSNLAIEATGTLVCNGTNTLGSVSSNATSFVVVPNPSEYEYLASSNNIFHRCVKTKLMYWNRKTLGDCGWKYHNQCYEVARTGNGVALHYWIFSRIANKKFHGLWKHWVGLFLLQTRHFKQILLEMQLEIILAKLLTCLATTAQQSQ